MPFCSSCSDWCLPWHLPDASRICIVTVRVARVRTAVSKAWRFSTLPWYQHWSNAVRWLWIDGEGAFGSDRGCEHLAHLLKSGHCKLQKLRMTRTATLGAAGMSHIARALKNNSSLTALGIRWCEVGDGGVEQLAAMRRTNSTLQELSLEGIGTTPQGLGRDGHLCDVLQSAQPSRPQATASSPSGTSEAGGLKMLDISRNEIGEGGAALLVAMLASNRCLRTLRAEGCSLVEEEDIDGEGQLAHSLRENRTRRSN